MCSFLFSLYETLYKAFCNYVSNFHLPPLYENISQFINAYIKGAKLSMIKE